MSTLLTPAERPSAKEQRSHPSQALTRRCLLEREQTSGKKPSGSLGPKTVVHDARDIAESCLMMPGTGAETALEMAHICSLDHLLASRYIKAAVAALKYRFGRGSIDIVDRDLDCRRAARYAIYRHMNVGLCLAGKFPPKETLPYPQKLANLLDRDSLFDAIIFGRLGVYGRMMLMPGFRPGKADEIKIRDSLSGSKCSLILEAKKLDFERVGEPISKVTIASEEACGMLFFKACSMHPEQFASALLSGTEVMVPELRTVGFTKPGGAKGEYGLILPVSSHAEISMSCEIGMLGHNYGIMSMLYGRAGELAERLGAALEICRLRGIQDRHAANVWVTIASDGRIRIAMIDLDLVGCYPYEVEKYQQEYAARLHNIAMCISEVFGTGASSTDPTGTLRLMKRAFLDGAVSAHSSDIAHDDDIAMDFYIHDGYPVGVFCRLGYVMECFPRNDAGESVTFNAINGPEPQRLIIGGPDSGRFKFDGLMAWKHGYAVQRSIKPEDFWEPVFALAEKNPLTTIVY